MSSRLPRLMLIGGPDESSRFFHILDEAVAGGLRLFQLRVREAAWPTRATLRRQVLLRHPKLELLVNGRADLAVGLGAGLHLPEAAVRPTSWPNDRLWGRSVHSLAAASAAVEEGAHYLVLGTVFRTPSKPGQPGRGLDFLRLVCRRTALPVYAIGGISLDNVQSVFDAGAHGVAVRGAIWAADAPRDATRRLCDHVPGSH